MDALLAILFGSLVGLSLGLTGGGGSILAVPMLVYGVHLEARQAALVSLCAVGGTALVGALRKIPSGEVQWLAGAVLGIGGVVGAPLGIWLAQYLPARYMLLLFSVLMLWVAGAMWKRARSARDAEDFRAAAFEAETPETHRGASCRYTPLGKMVFSSRCAATIAAVGVATGVLSGIFGVGGGFIVVPALTMLAGLDIRRAVATSLLVVGVVSIAGVVSGLLSGRELPLMITGLFLAGGVAGLLAGIAAGSRLSAAVVQKVFAVIIALVAVYVAVKAL